MTEDLERLLEAAQGQPPSNEFRERLRAQFLAAADGAVEDVVDVRDDEVTIDFELPSFERGDPATRRPRSSRRLQLLAGVAAAVLPLLGIWALSLDTDDPEDLGTSVVPASTVEAPEQRATPLAVSNMYLDTGTYRVDTLGTAFTFDVDEIAGVRENENGVVSIADLTSGNADDDHTITFWRTPLLPDPASLTTAIDPTTGWPATDVGGWLDALGEAVEKSDLVDTTLGGAEATSVEFEILCRRTSCAADDLSANGSVPVFTPGSRYRMFVVDQGAEDPIVVIVAIDDADDSWPSKADALLSSLEFDTTEPNPVRSVDGGAVELDAFGGITVEVGAGAVVVEPYDGLARLVPVDLEGDVEFLTRPLDTEGAEVTSIARLLQLLDDEAVVLTDVAAPDIDGVEGRAFVVDSGAFPNVVLKLREADLVRGESGWESPRIGHLWVFEHPDRGLLIVSSEAFEGASAVEPLRRWTEELLRSLEFRES